MSGASGANRVNRGGSWNNDAANARCSNRNNNTPDNRNNNLGFRLANTALFSRMPAFKDAGSANRLSSLLIRHAARRHRIFDAWPAW